MRYFYSNDASKINDPKLNIGSDSLINHYLGFKTTTYGQEPSLLFILVCK
jgi:hypothetical protein